MIYGIEVIGYGKRRRYCIKQLHENGNTPTDYRSYPTEAAAMESAKAMGYTISAIGDCYKLMAAWDRLR